MQDFCKRISAVCKKMFSDPAFILLLALAILILSGCSERIVSQSTGGIHPFVFDDVNVKVIFDLESDSDQLISVINRNITRPVGVLIDGTDNGIAIVFEDYYIDERDESGVFVPEFLEEGQEFYIDILVYNSDFSGWIGWAINHFPDSWQDWLDEEFGQDWLYDRGQYFVIL